MVPTIPATSHKPLRWCTVNPHCRIITPLVNQKTARKLTKSLPPTSGHARISTPTMSATIPRMRFSNQNLCTVSSRFFYCCPNHINSVQKAVQKHILQMYYFLSQFFNAQSSTGRNVHSAFIPVAYCNAAVRREIFSLNFSPVERFSHSCKVTWLALLRSTASTLRRSATTDGA
jgi:hypothetical protein